GLQTGDAGNYFVVVANPFGSVTSSVVTLTVLSADAPVIVTQPADLSTPIGSNITLTVTATGGQPLRYQWWLDEAPLDGATNASYNIANVQTNHEGEYFVVVTNSSGSATSAVASLTVLTALLDITVQPQDSTNTMGTAATFGVTTEGVEPISYQWWKDGTPLPGQTNDSLSLTSLELDDAGGYSVVVTNTYGSVTSVVATLTVLPTPPQTYTWISYADGDWDDADNWSPA